MGKSNIEWTEYTWNPVVGCSKVSPGCAHCYAETMAIRLAGMGQEKYQRAIGPKLGGGNGWSGNCYLSEGELEKPFHWKKSRKIFVCSMGDLFHENVPFEWIDRVMAVIAMNPRHKFMILTKRPERMTEYFEFIKEYDDIYEWFSERIIAGSGFEYEFACMGNLKYLPYCDDIGVGLDEASSECVISGDYSYQDIYEKLGITFPFPNLALGVTAETQETADLRIPILLQIPAAVRFVSIEPMLGAINLTQLDAEAAGSKEYFFINALTGRHTDMGRPCPPVPKLDWVIAGGETGPGARPMSPDWIYGVRDACLSADIPFYFKGWGLWKRWPFSREHKNKKYITIDGHKMTSSKLHVDYLTFNNKGGAYQYKQLPKGW